jgi:hypothetical protein
VSKVKKCTRRRHRRPLPAIICVTAVVVISPPTKHTSLACVFFLCCVDCGLVVISLGSDRVQLHLPADGKGLQHDKLGGQGANMSQRPRWLCFTAPLAKPPPPHLLLLVPWPHHICHRFPCNGLRCTPHLQEALMTSVIKEYELLRERAKSVLRSLFKAGDIDGDGNLTLQVCLVGELCVCVC